MSFFAYVAFPADGVQTDFQISFPYLSEDHIKAKLDGNEIPFVFHQADVLRIEPAPSGTLEVFRDSSAGNPLVDFLTAIPNRDNLQVANLQAIYLAQEAADQAKLQFIDTPFRPDALGPFADRAGFDNEGHGFSFLDTDTNTLFFRLGVTPGTWTAGTPFLTGPQGLQGPIGPQGDPGIPGTDGTDGVDGTDAVSIPAGGNEFFVLKKLSGNNFDFDWRIEDDIDEVETVHTTIGSGNSIFDLRVIPNIVGKKLTLTVERYVQTVSGTGDPGGQSGGGGSAGGSCFLGHMRVLMADGQWKRMDQVKIGDWIYGSFGGRLNQVTGIGRFPLWDRNICVVNDTVYMTAEECFWVPKAGFCPVNMADLERELGKELDYQIDDQGTMGPIEFEGSPDIYTRQLKLGDRVVYGLGMGTRPIEKIEHLPGQYPAETVLYSLVTGYGSGAMIVEGYLMAAWARKDFNYRAFMT